MRSKFLKIRMSANEYEQLKSRAAEAGKPISTFSHVILEQENTLAHTVIQLDEIKSQLQEVVVLVASSKNQPAVSKEINSTLLEILLITRELALERNAQILSRVAAQIKSQQGAK